MWSVYLVISGNLATLSCVGDGRPGTLWILPAQCEAPALVAGASLRLLHTLRASEWVPWGSRNHAGDARSRWDARHPHGVWLGSRPGGDSAQGDDRFGVQWCGIPSSDDPNGLLIKLRVPLGQDRDRWGQVPRDGDL